MKIKRLKASVTIFVSLSMAGIIALVTTMFDVIRIRNAEVRNEQKIIMIMNSISYDADKEILSDYGNGVSSAITTQAGVAASLIESLSEEDCLGVKIKNTVSQISADTDFVYASTYADKYVINYHTMDTKLSHCIVDLDLEDRLVDIKKSIKKIEEIADVCQELDEIILFYGADELSENIYKKVNSFSVTDLGDIGLNDKKKRERSVFNNLNCDMWTEKDWQFFVQDKERINNKDNCYKSVSETLNKKIIFHSSQYGFSAGDGLADAYIQRIAYAEHCFSNFAERQSDSSGLSCEYEAVLTDSTTEKEAMTEMLTKIYKQRYVLNLISIHNSSSYRSKLKNVGYNSERDAIALSARKEALYDILKLINSETVPLLKTGSQLRTHHRMSIADIRAIKTTDAEKSGRQVSYKDYMRYFSLYGLTSLEMLTARIVNESVTASDSGKILPDKLSITVTSTPEFTPCSVPGLIYKNWLRLNPKTVYCNTEF